MTAADLEESGDKSKKAVMNAFKQNTVEFYDGIGTMTFLVPESEDEKRAAQYNEEIKEALTSWTLCQTEFVSEAELNKRRAAKEKGTFYFKDIPVRQGAFFLRYNLLLSTEDDSVVYGRLGKKNLDTSSMVKLQEGLVKQAEKTKMDLTK